jgi:hypothetical protein
MKIGMVDLTSLGNTTPDSFTRTMSSEIRGEEIGTFSSPTGKWGSGGFDRLYLRDITLTVDYRGIIGSTIAGIEGSGGPISMTWIEPGSEGVGQGS